MTQDDREPRLLLRAPLARRRSRRLAGQDGRAPSRSRRPKLIAVLKSRRTAERQGGCLPRAGAHRHQGMPWRRWPRFWATKSSRTWPATPWSRSPTRPSTTPCACARQAEGPAAGRRDRQHRSAPRRQGRRTAVANCSRTPIPAWRKPPRAPWAVWAPPRAAKALENALAGYAGRQSSRRIYEGLFRCAEDCSRHRGRTAPRHWPSMIGLDPAPRVRREARFATGQSRRAR